MTTKSELASSSMQPLRPWTAGTQFLVALMAWTLFGVFGLVRRWLQLWASGAEFEPGEVADHLETMALWAVFTPLIFQIAERFPVERGRIVRRLSLHACAALLLSGLDVCLDTLILPLFAPGTRSLGDRFFGEAFINVFSYFALLCLGLAVRFYRLYHERLVVSAQLEAELLNAKLDALEDRLRPHFLYNALHAIGGLVRTEQPAAALRMIAGLGDLLRQRLSAAGVHEVPLWRELELAHAYLSIEQARFGERLRVHMDVAADVENVRVPSLLLQPLLENAVRHGIEASVVGGDIFVRIYRRGAELCIDVENSGSGSMLCGELKRAVGRPKLGLATTRARLQHLYGVEQTLALQSAPAGGTLVSVRIPFQPNALEPTPAEA